MLELCQLKSQSNMALNHLDKKFYLFSCSHGTAMPALVCFLLWCPSVPHQFCFHWGGGGVRRGCSLTIPHCVQSNCSKNGSYKYKFFTSAIVTSKSMLISVPKGLGLLLLLSLVLSLYFSLVKNIIEKPYNLLYIMLK